MVFVTGSTGMVGSYLVAIARERGITTFCPTRHEFDLGSPENLPELLDSHEFTSFIHLAAETDVDLCERNPSHAYKVNALGTGIIAQACSARNIDLLYVSTSNVFGGIQQYSYNELDAPLPLNYYGKSKLKGEEFILRSLANNYIVRAGWMIGGGPELDKKFVGKMLKQIADGNKSLSAIYDKYGSLTYAKHLAIFTLDLLRTKKYGTYHLCSSTPCSRFEIAKALVKQFGHGKVELRPCSSVNFPLSAPRPFSEAMESVCTSEVSSLGKYSWEELLEDYMTEWPRDLQSERHL